MNAVAAQHDGGSRPLPLLVGLGGADHVDPVEGRQVVEKWTMWSCRPCARMIRLRMYWALTGISIFSAHFSTARTEAMA